jgi:hypothetical protein
VPSNGRRHPPFVDDHGTPSYVPAPECFEAVVDVVELDRDDGVLINLLVGERKDLGQVVVIPENDAK